MTDLSREQRNLLGRISRATNLFGGFPSCMMGQKDHRIAGRLVGMDLADIRIITGSVPAFALTRNGADVLAAGGWEE